MQLSALNPGEKNMVLRHLDFDDQRNWLIDQPAEITEYDQPDWFTLSVLWT